MMRKIVMLLAVVLLVGCNEPTTAREYGRYQIVKDAVKLEGKDSLILFDRDLGNVWLLVEQNRGATGASYKNPILAPIPKLDDQTLLSLKGMTLLDLNKHTIEEMLKEYEIGKQKKDEEENKHQ